MPPKLWPHVNVQRPRPGAEYAYFRPTGARLPGPIGGEAFRAAYAKELAFWTARKGSIIPAPRNRKAGSGSVSAMIADYQASTDWTRLSAGSKSAYGVQLRWLEEQAGKRPIAGMNRQAVNAMLAARAKVGAGTHNLFLAVLRVLVRHAIVTGARPDDPTIKIRNLRGGEHRAWTNEELTNSKATHKIKTKTYAVSKIQKTP